MTQSRIGADQPQPLVELLRKLSELPGPSGQERAIAAHVSDALAPYCDSVRRDALDNVIAHASGEIPGTGENRSDKGPSDGAPERTSDEIPEKTSAGASDRVTGKASAGASDRATEKTLAGALDRATESTLDVPSRSLVTLDSGMHRRPRIMFAAHSDEIGLIVTKIDKNGFLRFTSVGGVDARAMVAQQVTVLTDPPLPGFVGVKPPHILSEDERGQVVPLEDMFIDVGLPEEAVRKRVRPGDMVVLQRQFSKLMGGRVTGKALDNRAGVAAMIEAMRMLTGLRHVADVYPVATVQEEVGFRGAIVSAYGIVPDMAIAIDVGFGSAPGIAEDQAIGMGKGPAIARGANVHPRLFELLVDVAKKHGIPYQIEPMPASSGTDGWALQVVRSGIPTAVVSIPLRYMHTSIEVVDMEDVRNTGRLLAHAAAALTEADAEGWSYALT